MQRTASPARRAGRCRRTPFQAAVAAALVMAATIPALAGDGQAPSTSVHTPKANEEMPAGPVTLAGAATDDSGVAAVQVAIQHRDTKDWWRADGSWGRFQRHDAILASPGAVTSGWTFAWPAPSDAGSYGALVEAVDATGNRDPNRPWVRFSVAADPASPPEPPDAPDVSAPTVTITVPAPQATVGGGPAVVAGTATDDLAVAAVWVAIQDRGSRKWWRSEGTWGAFTRHEAALEVSGAPMTAWTFAFTAERSGDFGVLAGAVDGAGRQQDTTAWTPFSVIEVTDPPDPPTDPGDPGDPPPDPEDPPEPPTDPAGLTPMRRAAPTYMGGSPSVTLTEALDIASHHDVILSLHHTFAPHLAAMRSRNPALEVFVYVNGMFSFPGNSHPESAYAHDRQGDRITSSFGNLLMEPSSAQWHAVVSGKCAAALRIAAYDGCFLDNMGTGPIVPGYLSDVPVRPGTTQPYNRSEWMALNVATVDAVLAANPGARVSANGLGNGDRYFASEYSTGDLFDAVDVAMSEIWLREPKAAVGKYRSETSWRRDIDMIVDAEARGKSVVAVTKLWTSATAAQERAWHRYALASFLLGTNGASSFVFSAAKSFGEVTAPSPWEIAIGEPQGPYQLRDGVYQREFAGGLVVVNPSDRTVTVPLPGTFRDLDGTPRTSLTLASHTGEVLARS